MKSDIDYGQLLDKAMYVIVKKALQLVAREGLPGNHHFFISFATDYPGVVISKRLLAQYPKEMTIVLQYQFDNLNVTDDHFEVSLNFNGVNEHLIVPFVAIAVFADPSVSFSLQFKHHHHNGDIISKGFEDHVHVKELDDLTETKNSLNHPKKGSNVISLADYRKKK